MKKSKKKSKPKKASRKPVARRKTRPLTQVEKKSMASRSRPKKRKRVTPPLDVSLPVAHPGEGYRIVETFVARNETAILDIVVPADAEVASWCCYARPAKGKTKDWHVVANYPDGEGRYPVPVPRGNFYVWDFGEAPGDAERGERVYRLHGHNIAYAGIGRDVCWRLILRLAPIEIPIPKQRTPKPRRKTAATVKVPARRREPVRVPA